MTLPLDIMQHIELTCNLKQSTIEYLLKEYPTSEYHYGNNSLYIKGKAVEKLTYFILKDTNLITIDEVLEIVKQYGMNINSTQSVRNYIHLNKLPNPNVYIGRFAYFSKPELIKYLEEL